MHSIRNQKFAHFAKYFGLAGLTTAAIYGLSACSLLEKFDFEITIAREEANLSYLNVTGTASNSIASIAPMVSADPLATVSKGTTRLTTNPDLLNSDYTKKIISQEIIDHHWGEETPKATLKGEVDGKITAEAPLKFFLNDDSDPLTTDEVLTELDVDISSFNYLLESVEGFEVYYQKEPDSPAFLHQIKINLRDDNYWTTSEKNFMNGDKERRKVKASDWLAAARIEMEFSFGAPYNYMWDINSGLNNAHECISGQKAYTKNGETLKNMLQIEACENFFANPEENSGSGYYANDEDNQLIMTFTDSKNPNNTGQNLPIGIVISEMSNVMYWPISQTFFHDRYDPSGTVFTDDGNRSGSGLWNKDTDVSTMKELISPFGTTKENMIGNGPFFVGNFEPGYAIDFYQNPDYWNHANTMSEKFRIRLGAIQAGGAVISDRFRYDHQSYAEVLPYSSKDFFAGTSADKFVGPQPDTARSIYLSFNTANGFKNIGENDLQPIDPSDPKTNYYSSKLPANANAMLNRNFRRALNYAFDYQKFWNSALLQYSPVMSQWADAGTSSAVTAPNPDLTEGISFQDYLQNTTYNVPTGSETSVPSKIASFGSKEWNNYFEDPPENFDDFRFNTSGDPEAAAKNQLAAANYYWGKWVEEANKIPGDSKIPDGRVSLNMIGNPTGTPSKPFLLALDQSLKATDIGDSVSITAKDVNDYFNSAFYRGAEGVWDLGTAGWNPDYLDPATFYSTLMPSDAAFGVSNTGNWNYTMELLYLLQPGNEEELNSWLDPTTTDGTNKNKATLGLLGSTAEKVALKILDAFTMSYNGTKYGPEGETEGIIAWSSLIENDNKTKIKELYSNLMKLNPAVETANGFTSLAQSKQFWKWENNVRFASMVGMEILIHSGSAGLSTSSNALVYGGSRLVGTSIPASGDRDFQFSYDCSRGPEGAPTCDDLW